MSAAGNKQISLPILDKVSASIVLSLPFMRVFSLDVGFPFKIYEIAIILSTIFSLVSLHLILFNKTIFARGVWLVLYALAALGLNLYVMNAGGPYDYLARFSPAADGVLKCGYVLLCVLGFNLIASAAQRNPSIVIRYWLIGATASAGIQFFFAITTILGYPVPHLPGMPEEVANQQFFSMGGIDIYRAGTFAEGNYAGPFFVLSFLIAVFSRRYYLALVFVLAIITSFSTTAVIGLGGAAIYLAYKARKNVIPTFLAITTIIFFINTPLFNTVVLDKLADQSESTSLSERLTSIETATELFIEHPLLGVGLAQFGFFVPGVQSWFETDSSALAEGKFIQLSKGISNNVYVELASELGLVGLIFFVRFMFPIVTMIKNCPYATLQAGMFAIFIFWIAAPTFTLMYYWAFLALVCGVAKNAEGQEKIIFLK